MNPETKKWVEDVKGYLNCHESPLTSPLMVHLESALRIIESQEKRIEELEGVLKYYAEAPEEDLSYEGGSQARHILAKGRGE